MGISKENLTRFILKLTHALRIPSRPTPILWLQTLYSPRPPLLFSLFPFPRLCLLSRGKHRLALSPHIADAAVTCACNANRNCLKLFFRRRKKSRGPEQNKWRACRKILYSLPDVTIFLVPKIKLRSESHWLI